MLGIVTLCITWHTITGIASGSVCMKDDRREQIPVDGLPMRRAGMYSLQIDFGSISSEQASSSKKVAGYD